MKKIKSLQDIQYIIDNKLDIKNDLGVRVPYINLIAMRLIEIVVVVVGSGEWTYDDGSPNWMNPG